MRELAKEARSIFEPGRVSYCWVPREQNGLADALVNEMLDLQQSEGSVSIRRLNGHLTEDRAAEDLVGGIEVEHARAMVADQAPKNVMIGWADLAIPTTTVLARHGATALSLEKRFSGRGGFDAPLAPLGERQAQALAEELALREPFDRIISSPLLRTRQTAHFVANRLGLPVEVEDGFAECGFGDWDGLTFSEVKNRWPNHLEEWLASTSVAPPGGESFEQCHDRVERARHAVVKRCAGERVLIVAHVTPIKLLVSTAVGAPLQSLFRMELMPCSISTLAWFPDGNASMFTFAESAHLRGIPIPAGT
jgi:probable phosphoglycerate mutase